MDANEQAQDAPTQPKPGFDPLSDSFADPKVFIRTSRNPAVKTDKRRLAARRPAERHRDEGSPASKTVSDSKVPSVADLLPLAAASDLSDHLPPPVPVKRAAASLVRSPARLAVLGRAKSRAWVKSDTPSFELTKSVAQSPTTAMRGVQALSKNQLSAIQPSTPNETKPIAESSLSKSIAGTPVEMPPSKPPAVTVSRADQTSSGSAIKRQDPKSGVSLRSTDTIAVETRGLESLQRPADTLLPETTQAKVLPGEGTAPLDAWGSPDRLRGDVRPIPPRVSAQTATTEPDQHDGAQSSQESHDFAPGPRTTGRFDAAFAASDILTSRSKRVETSLADFKAEIARTAQDLLKQSELHGFSN